MKHDLCLIANLLFASIAVACLTGCVSLYQSDEMRYVDYEYLILAVSDQLPERTAREIREINSTCILRREQLSDAKAKAADRVARHDQVGAILTGLVATAGGLVAGVASIPEEGSSIPMYAGFATSAIGGGITIYSLFSNPGKEQLTLIDSRIRETHQVQREAKEFLDRNTTYPWSADQNSRWQLIYGTALGLCREASI